MARDKKTFGAAAAIAKNAIPEPEDRANLVIARYEAVDNSQNSIKANQLLVEPHECKLWDRHNRNYDRLNEINCRGLIDSFISSGRQETPAWVRRVSANGPVKYEIIAGARRFWTVNWLRKNNYRDFRFFIEVREMTNEEAFRLSNLENLDRADISDYERALDYRDALDFYYNGKQSEMADRLKKTESWVSRYLTLAQLPEQIANAYADWNHLKKDHAKELLRILSDDALRPKMLQLATDLDAKHRNDEIHKHKLMSGAEVFKCLKSVGKSASTKFSSGPIRSYGPKGSPHFDLQRSTRTGLSLFVPKKSGADIDDLMVSFRKCLEEYYRS